MHDGCRAKDGTRDVRRPRSGSQMIGCEACSSRSGKVGMCHPGSQSTACKRSCLPTAPDCFQASPMRGTSTGSLDQKGRRRDIWIVKSMPAVGKEGDWPIGAQQGPLRKRKLGHLLPHSCVIAPLFALSSTYPHDAPLPTACLSHAVAAAAAKTCHFFVKAGRAPPHLALPAAQPATSRNKEEALQPTRNPARPKPNKAYLLRSTQQGSVVLGYHELAASSIFEHTILHST
jgi:hypothetical protein